MNSVDSRARMVGIFFLVAIVSGILGAVISTPLLGENLQLNTLAENSLRLSIAAFCQLLMAISVAAIAIGFYPVLRKHSEALALTAVVLRGFEGLLFIVCAYKLMTVSSLSLQSVNEATATASQYELLVRAILLERDWIAFVFAAIAFCLGALMYYLVLYRSKLVPRWLALWGGVAILLHLLGAFMVFFGADAFSATIVLLALPILLNELTLGLWLMIKGFSTSTSINAYAL
ncbi:MAG: DUF4386 domain-containing protein [Gammaproteobacteria bacterium]|nr:DUF4386 domain-containing protein [Gammaproteobacteria bacterium]MDH5731333.1 DUF4386 domain-containing protein [Gammaproteobacteria bacterium]